MDDIKKAVVQALEKQGVLSQLKAQLRAQVFIAIEEYESASGSGLAAKTSVPARKALLADPDGQLVVQLVLDLLDTCNLAFTKKVFQPELGPNAPDGGRQAAASKLGLEPASFDEPLLLALVKAFKAGSSGLGDARTGNANSSAAPMPAPAPSPIPAPAPAAAPAPPAATKPSFSTAADAPAGAPRPAAPLPRLDTLAPVNKPAFPPLVPIGASVSKPFEPPEAPAPAPAAAPSVAPMKAAAAPSVAPTKAAAEPSVEESGYDEDFEEELVEEEGVGPAGDDDEDDYAAALGFKSAPAASSSPDAADGDAGDFGRGRLGGGGSSGRGRPALDADLMAGDRSFGVSNELAGLDAGNSGGLSFSADYTAGPQSDMRGSLSTSQAMLSPISEGGPKLAKLEPLRPLGGKLSPLAPLAPLGSANPLSASLTTSKEDPLAKGPKPLGPLGAPAMRKSLDEKEELRRLGLLQSGDSLSNSVEVEPRPRPAGAPANIYDAEMSVSASMDDSGWNVSREERPQLASKGISMDLRETGLSATDLSGDIENLGVDLAETAEWH